MLNFLEVSIYFAADTIPYSLNLTYFRKARSLHRFRDRHVETWLMFAILIMSEFSNSLSTAIASLTMLVLPIVAESFWVDWWFMTSLRRWQGPLHIAVLP